MKLRITVDGQPYNVEVEALDASLPSAATRVESARLLAPPKRPASTTNGPRPAAPSAPAAATPPKPAAPAKPWHGVDPGPDGECLAPVPGTVRGVLAKPGQSVKAGEPIINIEVSAVLSPQKKPLIGTVRSTRPGTIAEVAVKEGDTVAFGQILARLAPRR